MDRHKPTEDWKVFQGRPDFIFFDGWCAGARPISEKEWKPPMNDLEKEEDPNGVWSKWSNKELAGDYQDLFRRFDLLLMIKVPGIEYVYKSRWLQEQTLEKTLKDPELRDKIMTKEEVYRFVMHYERLTQQAIGLIDGETDFIANLANLSALLNMELDDINWVGFYLFKEKSFCNRTVLFCAYPAAHFFFLISQ